MAGDTHLRAQKFPPPVSISAEARKILSVPMPERTIFPDLDDHAAWQKLIEERNQAYRSLFAKQVEGGGALKRDHISGVPVAIMPRPRSMKLPNDYVYMDIHGGGMIFFGGEYMNWMVEMTANSVQMEVVSIDYRMPPKYPYPAGLDDCLSVYLSLAEERGADKIIVGGSSAGGNLALALMLRLKTEGACLPAGLVLLSPEVDLTESGDSFQILDGIDILPSFMTVNKLYAADMALEHPLVSPLFGDFSGEFPPTFIQSGTRDLFLSNAVRLHRALRRVDADAELHIWEAMPHGRFPGSPEERDVDEEINKFIRKCVVGR
ncbi:hypothetical protein NT2_31_00010 [Caenibius tardaugens NBRC 16725]|uniref:Alpha/beta hydrolase fold-3 domain-containing protein n=1 Tax=Caenibius tardaugens NBRC 16725 TaxID=1219035 RepID=U3A0M8_9SPHN|nr:alpha/beta hydrolase [Caenibius tardaugens]AZI35269.1 alpha/beta hydrolase [Caenibius tardaugens NBRC 16725]GAD51204.1 hypothetical protein NT2_31_00010 [Caenibius tardaugens NBRC 16725]